MTHCPQYPTRKIVGGPRVDKLHTIHIIQADWNLLGKYCQAKLLMHHAEGPNQLDPAPWGSCKGRTAIDLAFKKCLQFHICSQLWINVIGVNNEVRVCYARVTEALSNLTVTGDPVLLYFGSQHHLARPFPFWQSYMRQRPRSQQLPSTMDHVVQPSYPDLLITQLPRWNSCAVLTSPTTWYLHICMHWWY